MMVTDLPYLARTRKRTAGGEQKQTQNNRSFHQDSPCRLDARLCAGVLRLPYDGAEAPLDPADREHATKELV